MYLTASNKDRVERPDGANPPQSMATFTPLAACTLDVDET
jgi:hypothetical protein